MQLATSAAARQAYRLGDRAWGIQFHAEVDRTMLDIWFDEGAAELPKPVDEVEAETDRNLGRGTSRAARSATPSSTRRGAAQPRRAEPVSAGSSGSRDHSCQEPT